MPNVIATIRNRKGNPEIKTNQGGVHMNKFLLKWVINAIIVISFLVYYTEATYFQAAVTATLLTIIAYFIWRSGHIASNE